MSTLLALPLTALTLADLAAYVTAARAAGVPEDTVVDVTRPVAGQPAMTVPAAIRHTILRPARATRARMTA